ncbi:puroindoline-B-like [Lolium rigidum]|uniref:puroindoline-B-like n=1 Tax=Lolium rigidum TaxID=89674 RepID=UPI001F5D2018|nr:puroindoline-B-like [Lolium rigidum]
MKTSLLLIALLALAASTTAYAQYQYAQYGGYSDQAGGGAECEQQQVRLSSCKDYVMERCMTMKDFPVTWPSKWWKGGCEHEVREQCCEQLNKVAQQCRCKAIWGAVQGELGGLLGFVRGDIGKRIQRAKSVPTKCNMGPECDFHPTSPTTGYYW